MGVFNEPEYEVNGGNNNNCIKNLQSLHIQNGKIEKEYIFKSLNINDAIYKHSYNKIFNDFYVSGNLLISMSYIINYLNKNMIKDYQDINNIINIFILMTFVFSADLNYIVYVKENPTNNEKLFYLFKDHNLGDNDKELRAYSVLLLSFLISFKYHFIDMFFNATNHTHGELKEPLCYTKILLYKDIFDLSNTNNKFYLIRQLLTKHDATIKILNLISESKIPNSITKSHSTNDKKIKNKQLGDTADDLIKKFINFYGGDSVLLDDSPCIDYINDNIINNQMPINIYRVKLCCNNDFYNNGHNLFDIKNVSKQLLLNCKKNKTNYFSDCLIYDYIEQTVNNLENTIKEINLNFNESFNHILFKNTNEECDNNVNFLKTKKIALEYLILLLLKNSSQKINKNFISSFDSIRRHNDKKNNYLDADGVVTDDYFVKENYNIMLHLFKNISSYPQIYKTNIKKKTNICDRVITQNNKLNYYLKDTFIYLVDLYETYQISYDPLIKKQNDIYDSSKKTKYMIFKDNNMFKKYYISDTQFVQEKYYDVDEFMKKDQTTQINNLRAMKNINNVYIIFKNYNITFINSVYSNLKPGDIIILMYDNKYFNGEEKINIFDYKSIKDKPNVYILYYYDDLLTYHDVNVFDKLLSNNNNNNNNNNIPNIHIYRQDNTYRLVYFNFLPNATNMKIHLLRDPTSFKKKNRHYSVNSEIINVINSCEYIINADTTYLYKNKGKYGVHSDENLNITNIDHTINFDYELYMFAYYNITTQNKNSIYLFSKNKEKLNINVDIDKIIDNYLQKITYGDLYGLLSVNIGYNNIPANVVDIVDIADIANIPDDDIEIIYGKYFDIIKHLDLVRLRGITYAASPYSSNSTKNKNMDKFIRQILKLCFIKRNFLNINFIKKQNDIFIINKHMSNIMCQKFVNYMNMEYSVDQLNSEEKLQECVFFIYKYIAIILINIVNKEKIHFIYNSNTFKILYDRVRHNFVNNDPNKKFIIDHYKNEISNMQIFEYIDINIGNYEGLDVLYINDKNNKNNLNNLNSEFNGNLLKNILNKSEKHVIIKKQYIRNDNVCLELDNKINIMLRDIVYLFMI